MGTLIYLIGSILAYLQARKNYKNIDEIWTIKARAACLVIGSLSWLGFLLCVGVYYTDENSPASQKIKEWWNKDIK